eukprot:Skav213183  [mRNA]  locus=scaffold11:233828:234958:- [translate_table: standard]
MQELICESGSPDTRLTEDMARGFDLMGEIPCGGIFPFKPLHACLLPEQVREMAGLSKEATWHATRRFKDDQVVADVFDATSEERARGWLEGPFELDELPVDAVLTRRFGVRQSSTLADGSRTFKTRPIDDFSESLINSTNSCNEAIQPMSIDMICAALVKRHRLRGREALQGKTIDLRKAYKNLPLSADALGDAYICVYAPDEGRPLAYQSLVLPFGARSAVMAFCRTSYAIWRVGVSVFRLHWTVYFDDFYLVAESKESRHIDLTQQVLFNLLGWDVSSEKEASFHSLTKILGIQIDLAESHVGNFKLCNVESRVQDLVSAIDGILAKQTMSTSEMRVLRGRLIFAEAQIFGRLAGKHMKHRQVDGAGGCRRGHP